jgi:hypothetical protein
MVKYLIILLLFFILTEAQGMILSLITTLPLSDFENLSIAQTTQKITTKVKISNENSIIILPKLNDSEISENINKKVSNLNKLILDFEKRFNEQVFDIINEFGKIKSIKNNTEIAFKQQIENI